jgi:phage-related minor tail protein
MATDAVWLDVLPSMKGFGQTLAKGAEADAKKAGQQTGRTYGKALLAGVAVVAAGGVLATKALLGVGETFAGMTKQIATDTGAAGDELDKLVDRAKTVSKQVPASFEDIGVAVSAVETNLGGLSQVSDRELTKATEDALNYAKAFDVDVNRATQVAGQVLKTGLVSDSQEAFNLLVASSQQVPAALREDLLDAADEYSPFFAQVGLSGEQAFAALVAGADKGAFGIDKTGDALKEFTIRATDMSESSGKAYEALGLDQEAMTAALLKGGDEGKAAFDKIVGGLNDMQDPVAQSQAALALFGTPLEDLGTDQIPAFVGSLAQADGKLANVDGAADRLGQTLNAGPREQLKILGNNLQVVVAPAAEKLWAVLGQGIGLLNTHLVPALKTFIEQWGAGVGRAGQVRAAFEQVWGVLTSLGGVLGRNKTVLAAFVGTLLTALAVRKVIAAFKAFNLVLRANPVGLVITAIAGLVAALVWLYRNNEDARRIMNRAWSAIKTVVAAVVDWFQRSGIPRFTRGLQRAGQIATWLWENAVSPALSRILSLAKVVFGWVRDTGWPWMRDALSKVGNAVKVLWSLYWDLYLSKVLAVGKRVFGWVRDTGWPWMRDALQSIGDKASWLWKRGIEPAFDGIGDVISAAWDGAKRVFDKFRAGIGAVKDAFGDARDGIGRVWGAITRTVAGPIRSVIKFINDKFIGGINSLLSKVPGVSLRLKLIPVPGMPASATDNSGARGRGRGFGAGGRLAFADGGMMPGYSPGRDTLRFVGPAGVLDLAGGEPVMRPEFGKVVGRGWVDKVNHAARTAGVAGVRRALGFARGGIIPGGAKGGNPVDWITSAAGELYDLVKDPLSVVKGVVSRLLGGMGNSLPGTIAKGALGGLGKGLGAYLKEQVLGGESGTGGGGSKGIGWRRMWGIIRNVFPDAGLSSAYRPGAVTASGYRSYHGQGRAVDLVGSGGLMRRIFDWIVKNFRNSQEIYFGPGGSAYKDGRRHYLKGVTAATHPFNHVHWAMADGGILDDLSNRASSSALAALRPRVFDTGGTLRPGLNLLDNRLGHPEHLTRTDQIGANPLVGHVSFEGVSADDGAYLMDELQHTLRRIRVGSLAERTATAR